VSSLFVSSAFQNAGDQSGAILGAVITLSFLALIGFFIIRYLLNIKKNYQWILDFQEILDQYNYALRYNKEAPEIHYTIFNSAHPVYAHLFSDREWEDLKGELRFVEKTQISIPDFEQQKERWLTLSKQYPYVGKLRKRFYERGQAEHKEWEEQLKQELRTFRDHLGNQLEERANAKLTNAVTFGKAKQVTGVIPRREMVADRWVDIPATMTTLPVPNLSLWQPHNLRVRHTYIIGKTGKGKSNLLRHLILQDIDAGRGVGVLTPEAEIIRDKLLPCIPPERIKDVIYFNPEDQERPVPFNPFHLDKGEKIHLKAQETFTVLERAIPEMTGARMRPLLSNTVYALIERPHTTIFDLRRLLDPNDDSFREDVIQTTRDEQTRQFFTEIFPTYPKDAHLPLINRLDTFFRPPVSTVLNNPTESLNFRKAMDEGKIIFFNLSTALLGDIASQLLGQLIVAKIQQAIFSRDDIPESQRTPFHLYIDEFQTYTATSSSSYSEILAKARKYQLALYLAHQQTMQIPRELLADILGNVSTILALNVSASDASRIGKELGLEKSQELTRLKIGEGQIKMGESLFKIQTPFVKREPDWNIQKQVIEQSRQTYGISPKAQAERPKQTIPNDTQDPAQKDDDEDEDFLY